MASTNRSTSALLCSVAITGALAACGTSNPPAPPQSGSDEGTSPSRYTAADAAVATRQLRSRGALLAGWMRPDLVTAAPECAPGRPGQNFIDCQFGQNEGSGEPSYFRVRLAAGGELTKILGDKAPAANATSPTKAAELLADDDELQRAPTRTAPYRCATSPRIEPSGRRSDPSTDRGLRCTTTQRLGNRTIARYVEFASDGTVARDYVIR